MSDALSQLPEAVAAAAVLLTVYYWGRQGHGRSGPQPWSGRPHPQPARGKSQDILSVSASKSHQ